MKLSRTERMLNSVIFVAIVAVYFIFGAGNLFVSGVLLLTLVVWSLYLRRISRTRMEKERKLNQEKADEYKKRIY